MVNPSSSTGMHRSSVATDMSVVANMTPTLNPVLKSGENCHIKFIN